MKKYLLLTFIITGVFLTKSCCWGPKATEKTIDSGKLSDTLKAYLPYVDSSFVSFLDTNNVIQEYLVRRKLRDEYMLHSKCKFCCKGILYNYRWERDAISFYNKKDTNQFIAFDIAIENHLKKRINFRLPNNMYNQFIQDSAQTYELLPEYTINAKTYKNIYKIYNQYFNDTSQYILFNKEFGLLKINFKNGKSISLL
jgi:hypothetical protein